MERIDIAGVYHPRVDPTEYGERTLVDDFKALDYRVAHFSGQDDSFSRSDELLGLDRVDDFYDAHADKDLRVSRSTSAGGLQVSSKLLTRRVEEYLADFNSPDPLFLYVNIVYTHFPYTHDELDNLLGVSPLTPLFQAERKLKEINSRPPCQPEGGSQHEGKARRVGQSTQWAS